jgi:hypothetical protein
MWKIGKIVGSVPGLKTFDHVGRFSDARVPQPGGGAKMGEFFAYLLFANYGISPHF